MLIRRIVKDSFLGIPLKYAGEVETIDEDRMESIMRGTAGTIRAGDPPNVTTESKIAAAMASFKESGKFETFYATYELLDDDGTAPF